MRLHHDALKLPFELHGWDRAIVIATTSGKPTVELPKPSATDVMGWVADPFNWRSIVSAQALQNLRDLNATESVHRFMSYSSLRAPAGDVVAINVMDADFIDAFRLGDSKKLGPSLTVAAANSGDVQRATALFSGGELLLQWPAMKGLTSEQAADRHKVAPAKQTLSEGVFAARPMWLRQHSHFYVSAAWMDSPGRRFGRVFPSMEAIVKIRPGVPLEAAVASIQAILDAHPSPLMFPGSVARALPLLDANGTDKTRRALLRAGHWIPLVMGLALALVGLAMIWLRFRALMLELALRRGFGQGRWAAALHTLRPDVIRLAGATERPAWWPGCGSPSRGTFGKPPRCGLPPFSGLVWVLCLRCCWPGAWFSDPWRCW